MPLSLLLGLSGCATTTARVKPVPTPMFPVSWDGEVGSFPASPGAASSVSPRPLEQGSSTPNPEVIPAPTPPTMPTAPKAKDSSPAGTLVCKKGSETLRMDVPAGTLTAAKDVAGKLSFSESECVFSPRPGP